MAAYPAALVEHPAAHRGLRSLEATEQLGDGRAVDVVLAATAGESAQRATDSHHRHAGIVEARTAAPPRIVRSVTATRPASPPRIAPGSRGEIGRVNSLIVSAIGRAAGTPEPPHLFTTLARHRRLFRRWLRFAGGLMPGGKLPRRDTELLILRVAHNCDCDYERGHHEQIAPRAGVLHEEIERTTDGPDAPGWSSRDAALLRAADELHAERTISDETWATLRGELSELQLIELCMLVGHYEMIAMTINGLRIQADEHADRPPSRLARLAERRR